MLAILTFGEQLWITIIDKAIIGLLIAVLERFKAEQTRAIESLKTELTRQATDRSAIRTNAQQLSSKISAALHSMCWLCWFARLAPSQMSPERISQYDQEMHVFLSELAGLETALAILDEETATKISTVVKEVEQLDADVGAACIKFKDNPAESCRDLAQLHQRIDVRYREMPNRIASIARSKLKSLDSPQT
jgi:chromosome condensin MukBEF ATPase and DNA-binding subunit MukB